jgi:hypothetical protein
MKRNEKSAKRKEQIFKDNLKEKEIWEVKRRHHL